MKFLKDAGIEGEEKIAKYTEILRNNNIDSKTLSVLTSKQELKEMGITSLGDIAKIIKAAEKAAEEAKQGTFKTSVEIGNS